MSSVVWTIVIWLALCSTDRYLSDNLFNPFVFNYTKVYWLDRVFCYVALLLKERASLFCCLDLILIVVDIVDAINVHALEAMEDIFGQLVDQWLTLHLGPRLVCFHLTKRFEMHQEHRRLNLPHFDAVLNDSERVQLPAVIVSSNVAESETWAVSTHPDFLERILVEFRSISVLEVFLRVNEWTQETLHTILEICACIG